MGGIETGFRVEKDDTLVRGSILVEGAPDNHEWARSLEQAVYERLAELERESNADDL